MSRPFVKDQRRKQILEAYAFCVAKYGVEGATLEKTAAQAGLARALIRHNVGNRSHLLDAFLSQFLENSQDVMGKMVETLPKDNPACTLCDWLFDPTFSDAQMVLISNALIAAAATNKKLAGQMQRWVENFITTISQVVATEYPGVEADKVSAVALGITGIYFNAEALYPLGNVDVFAKQSKQSALLLLCSLEKC